MEVWSGGNEALLCGRGVEWEAIAGRGWRVEPMVTGGNGRGARRGESEVWGVTCG